MINTVTLEAVRKRQQLAEEYASYSQCRGGLSKVIGGVVGIIVILTATILGGGLVTGVVTVVGTLLWLLGKEWVRVHLYRPFGEAQAAWSPEQRRAMRRVTLFVLLIAVLVLVFFTITGAATHPDSWPYMFFVILLAPVTWRFFRTPAEISVGLFLMAACAVHSVGGAYSLLYKPYMGNIMLDAGMMFVTWVPSFYAVILIMQGIREHRRFRELAAELGA
jgi:hypothetical protein